ILLSTRCPRSNLCPTSLTEAAIRVEFPLMLSRDRQRDSPFLLATIAGRAHVGRPVVTPLMSPGMTVGARCFIHWRAHSHNYILRTVVDNCRMLDRNDRVASLAAPRRRHGCDASALDDTLCRDFPRKRLAHNDALQAPRRQRARRQGVQPDTSQVAERCLERQRYRWHATPRTRAMIARSSPSFESD